MLPRQVNFPSELHIFSPRRVLTGSDGGETGGKRARERECEKSSTVGKCDWPINGAGCQCQRAQLWTVGNSGCRGALLKRSGAVRSGHSLKVYMAEVTGRMVNTGKRE